MCSPSACFVRQYRRHRRLSVFHYDEALGGRRKRHKFHVCRSFSVLRVKVLGGGSAEAGKIRFGVVDVTMERNSTHLV
jgi:hypothetical protein